MPMPLKHTEFTEPESPQCPQCGGRDLMRGSVANGKKRFKCRGCGRWSYGEPLPEKALEYPCPYCGGRCLKSGRAKNGRQRYVCTGCGKKNADLWPQAPPSPGGPFPHVMTFYLGPPAAHGLDRYCQAAGMSPAQAIREIFRRAARGPVSLVATSRPVYDHDGRLLEWVTTRGAPRDLPPTPIRFAQWRLMDVRSRATRLRMAGRGFAGRHEVTVYVVWKVGVALDDLAKDGLCRTMAAQNLTHQEAARYLLANARPPERERRR